MDAIDTTGSVAATQRAQLDYRSQADQEGVNPLRHRKSHGHHHGHHGEHHPLRTRDAGAEQPLEQKLGYLRSEKSVLKIRTQEGDVVSLRIRVGQALNLTTAKTDDGETQVAETRLAAKSSTRVSLTVKGELNPDEMAAIQSVFEQSAALAEEFFAGDIATAFGAASGFEIDAQQLARVSLRLKLSESLTYSGTGGLPPQLFATPPAAIAAQPAAEASVAAPTRTNAAAIAPPATTSAAEESVADEPVAIPAEVSEIADDNPPVEVKADPVTPAPVATSQTGAWFAAILNFVGALIESFDDIGTELPDTQASQASVSIDLSLKLRIFSSMLVEISEQSDALPVLVPDVIEAVATQQEPRLAAEA